MLRSFSRESMASRLFSVMSGADATQHVVGAELQDDELRAVGHRPVEPRQPAAGRVAGHAGIGDHDIVTLVAECFFKLFRKTLAGVEAVAGHQAVAETDDFVGLGPAGRRHRENGEAGKEGKAHGKPNREFESHAAKPI